jgi:2-polyprenyl-6-methoxyphenol hydroxylase-like FAD-dependent oxidoreductase
MTQARKAQVLIVGAGPTGLLLAAGLARYGIKPRLIDKNPYPSKTSKAIGVFARTLEVFDDFGVAEEAIASGSIIQGFNLYDEGDRIAHISLDNQDSLIPKAISLPQSETEAILTRLLERLGVTIERSVNLTALAQDADGVTATLTHANGQAERCQAAWLIGCDGSKSTVRQTAGFEDNSTSIPATFALADVEADLPLSHHEAHALTTTEGVLLYFPLPSQNHWRIIVDLPSDSNLPDQPDLGFIQQLAGARSPFTPDLTHLLWSSKFRIRQRMVNQCRKGRIFVAGDALSSHSPVGGQGMNTALQDAYNLAWKLALVIDNQASPELLNSYEAERLPISKRLLTATGLMTRALTSRHSGLRWLRRFVVSSAMGLDPVQKQMINTLTELNINYRHSPVVQEPAFSDLLHTEQLSFKHWLAFRNAPRAGDRAPDATVETSAGSKRLHQLFSHELKHSLLLFGGTSTKPKAYAKLGQLAQEFADTFLDQLSVHIILPFESIPAPLDRLHAVLLDPQTECHQRYGATGECLYLIRPDGYVGDRSQSLSIDQLRAYFQKI